MLNYKSELAKIMSKDQISKDEFLKHIHLIASLVTANMHLELYSIKSGDTIENTLKDIKIDIEDQILDPINCEQVKRDSIETNSDLANLLTNQKASNIFLGWHFGQQELKNLTGQIPEKTNA